MIAYCFDGINSEESLADDASVVDYDSILALLKDE